MEIQNTTLEFNLTKQSSIIRFNSGENNEFAEILKQKKESNMSTKQFLSKLDSKEMYALQKANNLADTIRVDTLSDEGAENLFLHPQGNDNVVDLNNDGIVEVGCSKNMIFPPPNAPASVKKAWKEATAGMSLRDLLPFWGRIYVEQIEKNSYKKQDGSFAIHEPGDAEWVNIFGDNEEDYEKLFERIINKIDHPLESQTKQQREADKYIKGLLTGIINKLENG